MAILPRGDPLYSDCTRDFLILTTVYLDFVQASDDTGKMEPKFDRNSAFLDCFTIGLLGSFCKMFAADRSEGWKHMAGRSGRWNNRFFESWQPKSASPDPIEVDLWELLTDFEILYLSETRKGSRGFIKVRRIVISVASA